MIKAIRENFFGIILFSSTYLLVWRIHEYAHLLAASLLDIKIIMSLNMWTSSKGDEILYLSGPLSTVILAYIGLFLTMKYGGIKKVFGFYLTLSSTLLTLGSLIVNSSYILTVTPLTELYWKLLVTPAIILSITWSIYKGDLGLKLSCLFWLIIISLIVGGMVFALDFALWTLYQQGYVSTIYGQITPVYIIDVALLGVWTYLINKAFIK